MKRRYTTAIVLAGVIASGGAVTAMASSGATATPIVAATGQSATAGLYAGNSDHGPGRGGFGGLTVTGVSGNTITATGHDGQTFTIQVTASTTYAEAGATATLSDIHAGSTIAVRRASTSTAGATTITAANVTILLPTTGGVVSAVSGNTITVTGRDKAARTAVVSSATRYQKAGQTASLADVTTGVSIMAEGALSGATLNAQLVTIQGPRVDGQVTAVSGASYTVKDHNGTVYTVITGAGTTYVNGDGTAATAAAVTVGVDINAEGTLSSDGKTLTAQRVTIRADGAGRGPGHGGDPRGGGPGGPGDTPPSIGTTGTATL